MLEPSSSEDEGGESTTTPYPVDGYDDTSSAISALSSQRDSGRQSQATNLSSAAGSHHVSGYHSSNNVGNATLHPGGGHSQQRSVTPCQPEPSPAQNNHHGQQYNNNSQSLAPASQQQQYLSDKFRQLSHLRATSPAPPEMPKHNSAKLVNESAITSAAVNQANDLSSAPPGAGDPCLGLTEDDAERAEREEQERKTKLQLYVFVLRCIAYPFNAKQPLDLNKRSIKITSTQLNQILTRFQCFLRGELPSISSDEAFHAAIQNYFDAFLHSNRLLMIVTSGACSAHDFREVFRKNIEKRVKTLPETIGMTKDTMVTQWLTKFDTIFRGFDEMEQRKIVGATKIQQHYLQQQQNLQAETILSKEQLYDMFQSVLKIKRFEHQLLYNAIQVSLLLSHFLSLTAIFTLLVVSRCSR